MLEGRIEECERLRAANDVRGLAMSPAASHTDPFKRLTSSAVSGGRGIERMVRFCAVRPPRCWIRRPHQQSSASRH